MTGALQDCQRTLARIQREQAAEEQAKQDEDQAEIFKVQNSICLDQLLSHTHAFCCSRALLAQFALPRFHVSGYTQQAAFSQVTRSVSNLFIVNKKGAT